MLSYYAIVNIPKHTLPLLQIFPWFWQWKNFENRLIFEKVKAFNKNCAIFWPPCIMNIMCWYRAGRQRVTLLYLSHANQCIVSYVTYLLINLHSVHCQLCDYVSQSYWLAMSRTLSGHASPSSRRYRPACLIVEVIGTVRNRMERAEISPNPAGISTRLYWLGNHARFTVYYVVVKLSLLSRSCSRSVMQSALNTALHLCLSVLATVVYSEWAAIWWFHKNFGWMERWYWFNVNQFRRLLHCSRL